MRNDEAGLLIKMLLALVAFITLLMWSFMTEAGDYRHHDTVNNYQLPTNTCQISSCSEDNDMAKGVALALATNHPFSFATKKWQGSLNGAAYGGQNAVSFGLAKRFDEMDALFHTSYGQNNGKDAISLGALFRF